MKIVFTEVETLGDDISLEKFKELGEVILYQNTLPHELKERAQGSDILIVNKVPVNASTLGDNPSVKLVCITATGTNIMDFPYAREKGIAVANVKGYSTNSVVQHTFALAFYLLEKLYYYDSYVKSGKYTNDTLFTHFENKFHELYGKVWGIAGLGEIGRKTAAIAKAFGCRVIYYSTSGKNSNPDFEQVDFDTLLQESDIISIHAPLTPQTESLFDKEAFSKMKASALLINVGRGPIVNESDLLEALQNNQIGGAGLDVLCAEPMSSKNPLASFTDSNRLIITPHLAWATIEARTRLTEETYLNVQAYLNGNERNIVS